MLENLPSNKKDIELQLMRRFDRDLSVLNILYPHQLREVFLPLFKILFKENIECGSLKNDIIDIDALLSCSRKTNYSNVKWFKISQILLNWKTSVYHLTDSEHRCLISMCAKIYPEEDIYVPKAC